EQGDDNTELTLSANWFFNGHRNKLTADISWLTIDDATTLEAASDWRFRIQWDISL
ncbi:MAG: porin, partial [Xanthomonadales bacterium]|nr:porin [Xanthomonadales bacterium]